MGRGNPLERQCPFRYAVTFQRRRAAVEKEGLAVMPWQPQKREHHIFVVALQENILRLALAEFEEKFDDVASGRSAIYIVTHEHHGVATLGSDCAEHRRKF